MDNFKGHRKGKQGNAELQDRVDFCITLLARGLKRSQILVNPTIISWGMTKSSIDKYLKHARNDIVGNAQQGRSEHLGRAVMNLDYLYQKALDGDDLALCLNIQKEKNRLLQLSDVYRPKDGKAVDQVLPADVRKMIDQVRVVNPPVKDKYLDRDYAENLIVGANK